MPANYNATGLARKPTEKFDPSSSKALVEQAEDHLRALLSDPYYQEAYHRLRRKGDRVLASRRGLLPTRKGALAERLLRSGQPKRRPGAPRKEFPNADRLFGEAKRRNPSVTPTKFSRALFDEFFPHATSNQRQKAVAAYAKFLRNRYRTAHSKP